METTGLPVPLEIWAAAGVAAQALIVALQARIRQLEVRLGKDSSNFLAALVVRPAPGPAAPDSSPVRPDARRPVAFAKRLTVE
jgi:hypothetical protein